MRPIYLQMIRSYTAEQGRRLLSALTSLINLALKEAIPDFARDAFYGASLIALNKKTGEIRPIAISSIYRRLASKICARFATGQLASQLRNNVATEKRSKFYYFIFLKFKKKKKNFVKKVF